MQLVAFIFAMALAAAIVPNIVSYANRKKLFDTAGDRKIHEGDIPRLGGIGVFAAFVLTVSAFAFLEVRFRSDISGDLRYWPIFGALISMFALGLVDDLKGLKARLKATVQLVAAILVVSMGFRFRVIFVPWGDGTLNLGFLSMPLTIAWIIGVTNAMNLIDGMDGLLGGITVIASLAFGLFFSARHDVSSMVICFSLAGACIGFLIYNLPNPRARIFMGDAGALFIGFALSVLPLLNQTDRSAEIGLISAVSILGIPIIDTLAAIIRRVRAGVHFFTPDRGHLHHMLLDLGFSAKQILAMTYGTCAALSLAALSTIVLSVTASFIIKIASLFVLLALYVILVIHARAVENSGISKVGRVPNPEAPRPVRFLAKSKKASSVREKEA